MVTRDSTPSLLRDVLAHEVMVWVLIAEPLRAKQGNAREAEMDALKVERKGMD